MTDTEARFILGLPPAFTSHDLKRAYRRTASANHPDRGGSTERMVMVNQAYAVLSDAGGFDGADGDPSYAEPAYQPEPPHPTEPYIRGVSIVLAATWWITGIFDVLDQPRRLRPWILIGFPFAYLIVWLLVRSAVRAGLHLYNLAVRVRQRFGSPA